MVGNVQQDGTAATIVAHGVGQVTSWAQTPALWAVIREYLVIAALVLSPLSYMIKLVYDLPFTWIDPTLVLGAIAALLPPWGLSPDDRRLRAVATSAALFLGVYWLSAMKAVATAQFSGAEAYREPVRTTLGVLLCIGCVRSWQGGAAVRRAAVTLGWVAVAEVLVAAYLLIGLAFNLPMPVQWRTYQEAYWFRQAFYAGGIVWPRLGGTFVEAPPFGLYVLGAIIVLSCARRAVPEGSPRLPGRWMDAILWMGLLGSLSSQVLSGAMLWGLMYSGIALYERKGLTRWRLIAVLALLTLFGGGVYKKYLESKRSGPDIGSSVGERRAHTERVWQLYLDHPLLGIGPGQYGEIAMRESFSLYDSRVSPQFTEAELLAESGALGLAAAALVVGSILYALLAARGFAAASAFGGLILADSFQANWRWPIVFIAVAMLLCTATALSMRGPPARAASD